MKKILLAGVMIVMLLAAGCTTHHKTVTRRPTLARQAPQFGYSFAVGKLCPLVAQVDPITYRLKAGDIPVPYQYDAVLALQKEIINEVPVYQMHDQVQAYEDLLGRLASSIYFRTSDKTDMSLTSDDEFWKDYDLARKPLPC